MRIEFLDNRSVAIRNEENTNTIVYRNDSIDRQKIQDDLSQNIYDKVLEVWGNTPTLPDPEEPKWVETEPEPTEQENLEQYLLDIDFRLSMLEMGV